VGIGHTDAEPEQIHAAVDAGAQLSTHLGNGSAQMMDRHRNPLWPQLARDELKASIICDTFHLPADLVRVITRAKGAERIILVTDAMYVATLAPGRYPIIGTEIDLLPGGKVVKADGACLGGSALSMNRAVALFMRMSGASLAEALRAGSTTPAALLGINHCTAENAPAHLLKARMGEGELKIEETWVCGERVF
jgi:N-acetylglucosamine-6-phosphate deacetylase